MPITPSDPQSLLTTMVASAPRTTSSTSTVAFGWGRVTRIRAQLNVTAASGTDPTLDVTLEDSLDGTNWNTIGTFAQATGATREVKDISTPFAGMVRAKWVVAGTTPSFTFSVIAATDH